MQKGECGFFIGVNHLPINAKAELSLPKITDKQINLSLKPGTQVLISKLEYEINRKSNFKECKSDSDTLIISPGYPHSANLYNFGFVHTSTKAYISHGMKVDVFCQDQTPMVYKYEFDGSKVFHNTLVFLKGLIHRSNYKRVIIHFINDSLADIIESVVLYYGIKVYIYIHGADVMYRHQEKIATTYDGTWSHQISQEKIHRLDAMFKKFACSRNIKWLFVSQWIKNESEKLLGLEFHNSEVVHNGIDTNIFKYQTKKAEDRLNIMTIRRFDDLNTYAIDLVVGTILALREKPFFSELSFYIYGDGPLFDHFASMVPFNNVHFTRGFFSHRQISELHKNCGIILHPTRFDTMGCSSLEGVCSGLVLVSSNTTAVPEFTDPRFGTLSDDIENPFSYAKIIEDLYYSPERFLEISEEMSKEASAILSRDKILAQELAIFEKETDFFISPQAVVDTKILSICVPVYNIEKYLPRCINSLLSCENKDLLEIIIVNDGSTDSSEKLALKFKEKYPEIICLINKENGGHGSAILEGIKKASAKYFRIVDGDDWVDPAALDSLIKYLQSNEVDLVLTNYSIDHIGSSTIEPDLVFSHLPKESLLSFDDLTFKKLGCVMATSTYSTNLIKNANITLLEKCFFVDMEFNARAFANVNKLIYIDLPVYKYFIGRQEQSTSAKSFIANYRDHEKVIYNILSFATGSQSLSHSKRKYIANNLLMPMIRCQFETLFVRTGKYIEALQFYHKIRALNNNSVHKLNLPLIKLLTKSFASPTISFVNRIAQSASLIPYNFGRYIIFYLRMYNIRCFDRYAGKIKHVLLMPFEILNYLKRFFM